MAGVLEFLQDDQAVAMRGDEIKAVLVLVCAVQCALESYVCWRQYREVKRQKLRGPDADPTAAPEPSAFDGKWLSVCILSRIWRLVQISAIVCFDVLHHGLHWSFSNMNPTQSGLRGKLARLFIQPDSPVVSAGDLFAAMLFVTWMIVNFPLFVCSARTGWGFRTETRTTASLSLSYFWHHASTFASFLNFAHAIRNRHKLSGWLGVFGWGVSALLSAKAAYWMDKALPHAETSTAPSKSIEDETLCDRLQKAATTCGVAVTRFSVNDNPRDESSSVAVTGWLKKEVVIVPGRMSPDEITALVAAKLAHSTVGMMAVRAAVFGFQALVLIFAVVRLDESALDYDWLFVVTNYPLTMQRLILFAIMLQPLFVASEMAGCYIFRILHYKADTFVASMGYRDALVSAYSKKLQGLGHVDPPLDPLYYAYTYDTPTLPRRLGRLSLSDVLSKT